jgi:hypothetical protein
MLHVGIIAQVVNSSRGIAVDFDSDLIKLTRKDYDFGRTAVPQSGLLALWDSLGISVALCNP